ncbi:hypothetical protein [Viridibacterium curvum]|uniref:Lipoprotein n=1 Tax=Viridibacterium curvum TaxID=1101404 RepID=A0ABP9QJ08_9RHOO
MKSFRHSLALAALSLASSITTAACNNPANWYESPSEGVKFVIGYEADTSSLGSQTMNGLTMQAYPDKVSDEVLARHGSGSLKAREADYVSYFEPNPAGGWRLCRKELWVAYTQNSPARPAEIAFSKKAIQRNKRLDQLPATHILRGAIVYLFDAKGRIDQKFFATTNDELKPTLGEFHCYRYDDKDRVLLWVKANVTERCPSGEPDVRDNFHRFEFAEIEGKVWHKWIEQHFGNKDGDWAKDIDFSIVPAEYTTSTIAVAGAHEIAGGARVTPTQGVTKIQGGTQLLGAKDKSHNYKWPYASGGLPPVEYFFTKPPVPISLLRNPEDIYQYDRRRETDVSRVIKLVEHFKSGEHQVRDRFYTAMGRTVRQEQYDEQGRLKRVINLLNLDPMQDGKFYGDETQDLKQAKISLRLKTNLIYYRVWEYNAAGKPTLVALGWNNRLGSTVGKKEMFDFADIRYGTPDGKEKWKSKEEFFKAFDYDPYAKRAYPKGSEDR